MSKCDTGCSPQCPICYPNWAKEEAAAKKRAEDGKRECMDGWRFYQQKAEAIVAVNDPVARNRRINAAYARLWIEDHRFQWKLRESIYWPDARSDLFAKKEDEIRLGFAAIENLDIAAGVKHLAEHEQLHMLQPILYDDVAFATMMRANHVAWVLNMPSGSVQELQLTLANRCTVTGGDADKVSFSKHPLANLADPVQRMEFVVRAANQFEELLKHRGPDVENSLHIIGNGGR